MLAGSWGVESRDDLLATLVWIEQGGHRQEFDTLAWELSSLSSEQLADVHSQAAADPALANEIDIVEKNAAQLGSKSISGWDYARYVYLCRCGYLAGYLTEDEMWQRSCRRHGSCRRRFLHGATWETTTSSAVNSGRLTNRATLRCPGPSGLF